MLHWCLMAALSLTTSSRRTIPQSSRYEYFSNDPTRCPHAGRVGIIGVSQLIFLLFNCTCYVSQAGSFTKYSRKYLADATDFSLVSAKEVGCRLADVVLGKIDPLAHDVVMQSSQLIDFTQPKVVSARVPGSLAYLHVCPPQNLLTVSQTRSNLLHGFFVETDGSVKRDDVLTRRSIY